MLVQKCKYWHGDPQKREKRPSSKSKTYLLYQYKSTLVQSTNAATDLQTGKEAVKEVEKTVYVQVEVEKVVTVYVQVPVDR